MTHLTKCVSFSLILISLMGFVMVPMVMGAAAVKDPSIANIAPAITEKNLAQDYTISGNYLNEPNTTFYLNGREKAALLTKTSTKVVMKVQPEELNYGENIFEVRKVGVLKSAGKTVVLRKKRIQVEDEVRVGQARRFLDDWEQQSHRILSVDHERGIALIGFLMDPSRVEQVVEVPISGGKLPLVDCSDAVYAQIFRFLAKAEYPEEILYGLSMSINQPLPANVKRELLDQVVFGSGIKNMYVGNVWQATEVQRSVFDKKLTLVKVDQKDMSAVFVDRDGKEFRLRAGNKVFDEYGDLTIRATEVEYDTLNKIGKAIVDIVYEGMGKVTDELGPQYMRVGLDVICLKETPGQPRTEIMCMVIDELSRKAMFRMVREGSDNEALLELGEDVVLGDKKMKFVEINGPEKKVRVDVVFVPKEIELNIGGAILAHEEDIWWCDRNAKNYVKVLRVDDAKRSLELALYRAGVEERRVVLPEECSYMIDGFVLVNKKVRRLETDMDIIKTGPNGRAYEAAISIRSEHHGGTPAAERLDLIERLCLEPGVAEALAGDNSVVTARDLALYLLDGRKSPIPGGWTVKLWSEYPDMAEIISEGIHGEALLNFKEKMGGHIGVSAELTDPTGRILRATQKVRVNFAEAGFRVAFDKREHMQVGERRPLRAKVVDRKGSPVTDAILSIVADDLLRMKVHEDKTIEALAAGDVVLAIEATRGADVVRVQHRITIEGAAVQ